MILLLFFIISSFIRPRKMPPFFQWYMAIKFRHCIVRFCEICLQSCYEYTWQFLELWSNENLVTHHKHLNFTMLLFTWVFFWNSEKHQTMNYITLEDLPNELILKVISYLNFQELLICGQISRRIRTITYDERLQQWQKFNFYREKAPSGLLKILLENGCKYLSLSRARIIGPLDLNKPTRLKYLNLSTDLLNYSKVPNKCTLIFSIFPTCSILFETMPLISL